MENIDYDPILSIMLLGFKINIGLFILHIVISSTLIFMDLKSIVMNLKYLKPITSIREKHLSWVKKHYGLISLFLPFSYILVFLKDIYIMDKLKYNFIHLIIYTIDKDIEYLNIDENDKKILEDTKHTFNYNY